MNQYIPGIAALMLYLASAALLWRSATTEQDSASLPNSDQANIGKTSTSQATTGMSRKLVLIVGAIALLGVLLHATVLHGTAFKSGALNFSFFNSLSVTAWFTVILLLLVSIARPVLSLGLIVFPASAAVLGCALLFAGQHDLSVEPQLQWHVLILSLIHI